MGKEWIISHYYRDISTNQILNKIDPFDNYDKLLQFVESLNNTERKDYIERIGKKEKGKKGGSKTIKS